MADAVKMVIVDGVRYREEDAPKKSQPEPEKVESKARTPRNKARTTSDTDDK